MSLGVYAASLGMDGVGVYCSWEMPGPGWLVDPPSSPARRSWGKVLLCHKGLGGVFCVSGPGVCQPKGPVYQLEYLLLVQLAFSQSFLVGLPSCTVVPSHSSPLLSCILFPLFSRVVPHLVCVLFPHPIHLPPSCSPLSPRFVFCPSHQ